MSFPSSHPSSRTTPSPHCEMQEPSEQSGSAWQSVEQPSNGVRLPSSQLSAPSWTSSPQVVGVQTLGLLCSGRRGGASEKSSVVTRSRAVARTDPRNRRCSWRREERYDPPRLEDRSAADTNQSASSTLFLSSFQAFSTRSLALSQVAAVAVSSELYSLLNVSRRARI